MILEIKKWCEGIIVAVILCIIIESLIPNGNNKKYIKVIIGIYIMYVSLSPILSLLNHKIDFKNLTSDIYKYEEVSVDVYDDIKEVYILGIEENIKNKIKELGYEVDNVKVYVDINYENIEKIEIRIKDTNNLLEGEKINAKNKSEENNNYKNIIDYICQNYLVEKEKIIFQK